MPTYEFFDRLASDLSLNEIIAARMKKKVWARIAQRAGVAQPRERQLLRGPFDPVIAEKLRKLRLSLTNNVKPKPPVTHMKRSVLLKQITEFNARLDRIILGEENVSGKQERRKVTEFALVPAVVGGVLGSGLGAAVGKKKWNPDTGKWEDDPVTSAAGAVAGGAAGYGLGKAHDTILKNYGGEGGVKEAYRNAARNIEPNIRQAAYEGQDARAALAGSFRAAQKTKLPFGASMGYAKDIAAGGSPLGATGHVLGDLAKRLKNLKGAGTKALTKVFAERALPRELVEFESRIDAIVFADKKKVSGTGQAAKEVTEFAGGYVRTNRGVEKEPGVAGHLNRHAGVYIGSTLGLPIFPIGTAVGSYIDKLRQQKNILRTSALPKKKKEMSSLDRLVEFAQGDDQPKKKFLTPGKAFVAGLATLPLAGATVAAAGPGRHVLAGAAEALRVRRKMVFPPGAKIPADKVAEYLRMLHAGRIKA